jgi:L-2,4-diaminobutyrate transaminase
LTQRAGEMGNRLIAGFEGLAEFECVGNVRGSGLMSAVEFVADRETKAPANIGGKIQKACLDRGLYTRTKGDILEFSPPLIISEDEVDKIVEIVREAIVEVTGG